MSTHDHPIVAATTAAFPGTRVSHHGGHALTDPNPAEIAAMSIAGQRGGEYVESIGATDFATWTPDQWQTFIETVCGGYVDALMDMQALATQGAAKVRAP